MISLTRLVVSLSLLLASAPAIQAAGGKGNAPRGLRLRGMQPIEVQARRGGGWGWWGRDKAINITISADGPLVECSDVRLDWASDLIPKGRAVTYHIQGAYGPLEIGVALTNHWPFNSGPDLARCERSTLGAPATGLRDPINVSFLEG